MKRKLLCIILAACLVLSVVMPATALAAKGKAFDDFGATGLITFIDDGIVKPAGQSDRWIVSERIVVGEFLPFNSLEDPMSVTGPFTMTYKTNVDSEQAGTFHGELVSGELVFKVRGKSEMGDVVLGAYEFFPVLVLNPPGSDPPYDFIECVPVIFLALNTSGGWTLIEGAKGNGTYEGTTIVAIGTEGDYANHIVGIHTVAMPSILSALGLPLDTYPDLTPSSIGMIGKWKQ